MGSSVAFWIVALVVLVRDVKTVPKSGPFDIMTKRIVMCEDVGTNEVNFIGKMSSKGNGVIVYNSDVDFKLPWDDKLKADVEVQQFNNGAYTAKFVTQSFKNCEKIWKYSKNIVKGFFAASGYNFTTCPLPAGIYPVRDWPVNISFNQVPSFIYGSYKMIIAFSKDNKRVGCFMIYCDVVPKESRI